MNRRNFLKLLALLASPLPVFASKKINPSKTSTPIIEHGEARWANVSFAEKLDNGEVLTGTPVVTEQGGSDLAISNETINNSELVANGETIGVGKVVKFRFSGGKAGRSHKIIVECEANSIPAQKLSAAITLPIVSNDFKD